jgi:Bacteriophage holin of superfamily 6 (Holin_LLH)
MFGFLKRVARQPLNFEQLQILQIVVQQVVLSVEGTLRVPGANKKAVAIELVGQILEDLHLVAPDSLVDAMIESAVSILKSLDRAIERETKPQYTFDLSGRPKSGN